MEQGVNLLANFPLSSPFFFLTTEICGRPRKHINFAGKPVLKIILYGNGLTQGYSTSIWRLQVIGYQYVEGFQRFQTGLKPR